MPTSENFFHMNRDILCSVLTVHIMALTQFASCLSTNNSHRNVMSKIYGIYSLFVYNKPAGFQLSEAKEEKPFIVSYKPEKQSFTPAKDVLLAAVFKQSM